MTVVPERRRLTRVQDGRLVAGVCAGLADHLGVDVLMLRVGFVLTIALGGLGALFYAAFWVVVPTETGVTPGWSRPGSRAQLLSFAALGVAMLGVAQLIGFGADLVWPAAVAVVGAAIVWRQLDDRPSAGFPGSRLIGARPELRRLGRYAAGLALLLVGLSAFLALHIPVSQARRALLPTAVVVLGLLLVLGPWVIRALRAATEERSARIREHERVEIAGRLHDSTLQTMALIQQHVDEPDVVMRLVRRSEREIRDWLYSPRPTVGSLRAAVVDACSGVEDQYGVAVDLVMVGDASLLPAPEALVRAVREATVNAAKHAGSDRIDVYVEASQEQVTAFVRDRGCGFDIDAVPPDRYGIRESVVAAVTRYGGTAVVRSKPGGGTEVQLEVPLAVAT